jgi:Tol biopolymer transport system component
MSRRTFRTARTCGLALFAAVAGAQAAAPSAPSALATFPGRNGQIAFHSQTDAGVQIFTVRPNGHGLRQITHANGDATRPDWSPDGRRIVFELDTADSGSVAIMNADGSDMVVLPPAPGGFDGDPSFTPDGTRIIFERFAPDTNEDAIWSMNLDGGDRHLIGSGPAGATDPNVSPDGRALSFVSFNGLDFGQALATSRIDGTQQLQLTPFTFNVGIKQDWAPDGRHLTFIHHADLPDPGDSANIATIRPDGTDLRFLTHYQGGEVNAFAGSYSPDGRWIAFRLEDHGRFGLYKMHPDGSQVQPILELSSFAPRFIDWGARPQDAAEDDDR